MRADVTIGDDGAFVIRRLLRLAALSVVHTGAHLPRGIAAAVQRQTRVTRVVGELAADVLEDMGPTFVKVGQLLFLSTAPNDNQVGQRQPVHRATRLVNTMRARPQCR